jgi:cysteine desulfurase
LIYLDHHATTPVDPRVLEAMLPYFERDFGNAASRTHAWGWRAEAAVDVARERIAAALGARDPREIIFTSGATESNNLALLGVARAGRARGDHVVTTAIEHSSVLEPCEALEREGFSATRLPVDRDGRVDPGAVAAAITDRTLLVSVGWANGEIGTVQPIAAIAEACRARGVLLHSDAAQAVGKVPLDVAAGVDLLSISAHKLYGPKGVGALWIRSGRPRVRIEPLLFGGGHENGLRPGTLPVPLIVGFGRAVEIAAAARASEAARLLALRERLLAGLCEALPGITVHGHLHERLPGNLNLAFAGIEADALLVALRDVALSTGSACSSAHPEPSHVLVALGLPEASVRASVRIGLGRGTTVAEVDAAAAAIVAAVRGLRAEPASAHRSAPGA